MLPVDNSGKSMHYNVIEHLHANGINLQCFHEYIQLAKVLLHQCNTVYVY